MIIFSTMSTIIQQLHTAIKAGRHDVVEFIVVQNASAKKPVDVLHDEIVVDYISVCNNIDTVWYAVEKGAWTMKEKIITRQGSVGNTDVVRILLSLDDLSTTFKWIDSRY
jgi:hypothetical protein